MIKKLRRRFVFMNMLIVTLMLIVILVMTVNMTKNSLKEETLEALTSAYAPEKKEHAPETKKEEKSQKPGSEKPTQEAGTVATESTSGGGAPPSATGNSNQKALTSKEEKTYKEKKNPKIPIFTITRTASGEILAEGSDFYDLTDTSYLEAVLEEAMAHGENNGVLWNRMLHYLREDSTGTVYSFADISGEMTTLWNLVFDSLLVGIVAFGGFLLLSILLSRVVVKPVEKAWTQQQQFIADASHELKTPLTVIMTGAELLTDPSIGEDTRRQCVSNILETSQTMRSLTEEMLCLAKSESAQKDMVNEICNLSEIVEDAVLAFEPLFFEQGLLLEANLAPDITIKGNENQLRQLVQILLDNARKYSLPGNTRLTLQKQGFRTCEIRVTNPANEIKEDLEKLFERFYRVDQARVSSGSYGLGLSIGRSIVLRHSGTIRAEQKDGNITFSVQLPMGNG